MRTTIVSTSKLKFYKSVAIGVVFAVAAAVTIFSLVQVFRFHEYYTIFMMPLYIALAIKVIPYTKNIKNISYDDSAVYYDKNGFEVQIPFEDIKDIEIKTISGVYKLNLYIPTQDGKSIMFKTSLWYPFNFKKQDEKVNELRDKIERYKRTLPEKNLQGLSSYQI